MFHVQNIAEKTKKGNRKVFIKMLCKNIEKILYGINYNLEQNLSCMYIKVEEKDLNGNILVKTIDEILNDEEKIKDMKKNLEKLYVPKSATKIYETIRNIIDGK